MSEEHHSSLPAGYEFEGYRIESVLGSGSFGITYRAVETSIGREVAISGSMHGNRDLQPIRRMKAVFVVLVALAWLGLFPTALAAQSEASIHTVNGRVIRLIPEARYCALSEDVAVDAAYLDWFREAQEPHNVLLEVFDDCDELDRWRNSPLDGFSKYSIVLLAKNIIENNVITERQDFLHQLSLVFERQNFVDGATEQARQRLDDIDTPVQIGEMRNLGVLKATDDAVFVGVIMNISVESSDPMTIAGVFGSTVLNGIPVNVNYYTPFQDAASVEEVLGRAERHVRQLVQINSDYTERSDWTSVISEVSTGLIVGMIVGAFFALFAAIKWFSRRSGRKPEPK